MTVTSADIVNRALQLIGGFDNSGPVTGGLPDFGGSPAGVAAGVVYDEVVQTVGRQFGYDFSRNVAALTLSGGTAPFGFTYEYVYPTNGLQVRQVVPPTFVDRNDPRPITHTVGSALIGTASAVGTIEWAANPTNGATVTLNGVVITFVSGAPVGNQVQIGGTTAITIDNLISVFLAATTNPSLTIAAYTESGGPDDVVLHITVHQALGSQGNSYTLSASSGTRSGPTCTGGTSTYGRVIWTDQATASCTFTGQPPEDAWDSLFAETVVNLLASKLATALQGKPETAADLLQSTAAFGKDAADRTDT